MAVRQSSMASYFWIRVRRMTSVGWAVSTSSTRMPERLSTSRRGEWPAPRARSSSSESTGWVPGR